MAGTGSGWAGRMAPIDIWSLGKNGVVDRNGKPWFGGRCRDNGIGDLFGPNLPGYDRQFSLRPFKGWFPGLVLFLSRFLSRLGSA